MRVITGSARGTKLLCPDGLSVRPTHDRVKEAVFSMLTGLIPGALVLDLFAGSGALGIEALSRGAKEAVFVDKAKTSLATVKENLTKTRLVNQAQVIESDFLAFLKNTPLCFDIIFLDPPYAEDFLTPALCTIKERGLLQDGGIIYCETDGVWPEEVENLFQIVRDKKYGRAKILLLKELSI